MLVYTDSDKRLNEVQYFSFHHGFFLNCMFNTFSEHLQYTFQTADCSKFRSLLHRHILKIILLYFNSIRMNL